MNQTLNQFYSDYFNMVEQQHGIHIDGPHKITPRVVGWGVVRANVPRWSREDGGFLRNYIHVRMNVKEP